jgi:hypothetical protein
MAGTSQRELDLTNHENLDRVDRERWSKAFAFAFIKSQPSEAIIEIATKGFSEFLRVAKPVLEAHAFKFEDFQRIFAIIKREAETRARVRLD